MSTDEAILKQDNGTTFVNTQLVDPIVATDLNRIDMVKVVEMVSEDKLIEDGLPLPFPYESSQWVTYKTPVQLVMEWCQNKQVSLVWKEVWGLGPKLHAYEAKLPFELNGRTIFKTSRGFTNKKLAKHSLSIIIIQWITGNENKENITADVLIKDMKEHLEKKIRKISPYSQRHNEMRKSTRSSSRRESRCRDRKDDERYRYHDKGYRSRRRYDDRKRDRRSSRKVPSEPATFVEEITAEEFEKSKSNGTVFTVEEPGHISEKYEVSESSKDNKVLPNEPKPLDLDFNKGLPNEPKPLNRDFNKGLPNEPKPFERIIEKSQKPKITNTPLNFSSNNKVKLEHALSNLKKITDAHDKLKKINGSIKNLISDSSSKAPSNKSSKMDPININKESNSRTSGFTNLSLQTEPRGITKSWKKYSVANSITSQLQSNSSLKKARINRNKIDPMYWYNSDNTGHINQMKPNSSTSGYFLFTGRETTNGLK
eukprot:TRINITY_DN1273_c0_g2_i1.p1 TRINITY_DN1273_c0_g2~~TRINITY_DN1273_c0_g2_i1.p1  ORF type:complete len:514 (-),score=93.05 TRINITY_DN1273_c0_g2_i1:1466-2914(-)